jgi:hypothetical protein
MQKVKLAMRMVDSRRSWPACSRVRLVFASIVSLGALRPAASFSQQASVLLNSRERVLCQPPPWQRQELQRPASGPARLCTAIRAVDGGGADTRHDTEVQTTRPPLHVLFQDEHLAVLSKPGGMLMHRTRDSRKETVFFLQTARDQLGKQVPFVSALLNGVGCAHVIVCVPGAVRRCFLRIE